MSQGLDGVRVEGPGMRHAAVRALVAVGAGIAASRVVDVPAVGLAAAVAGIFLWRWTAGRSLYLLVAAGAFMYALSRQDLPPSPEPPRPRRFQGVVVEEPSGGGANRIVVEPGPGGRGKVLVYRRDQADSAKYGDLVEVDAKVEPFSFPRNPGVVDYNEYYRQKGMVGRSSPVSGRVRVIASGKGNWFVASCIQPCRRYLRRVARSLLPEREAGVLVGLVVGELAGLDKGVLAAFRAGGVMHVLAVSGLHVGIVLGVFWLVLAMFGIRGWWRFGVSVAAIGFYVFLTGARAPALRAGLMAAAALAAVPAQRRLEPLASLSAAGILLLLLNPEQLFESGFQLSFAAVAAIVLAVSRFSERLRRSMRDGWPVRRLRQWVVLPLLVSCAAFVGTGPILLHHFHRIQLLAPISSFAIVPLVGVAIPLGLLVSVVNLGSGTVASVFAQTLGLVLTAVTRVAAFFGRQNWAILEPGRLPWVWALWFYGLLLLVWNWRTAQNRKRFGLVLLLGLNLLAWKWALTRPQTSFLFLDPGKGDAVLVQDTLGRKVLFDAGINKTNVLRDYLRGRGIKRLDLVVLSHPDVDHYGGLLDLDRSFRIGTLVVPTVSGGEGYEGLIRTLAARGTKVVIAEKGSSVQGVGFGLDFVWPEKEARSSYRQGMLSSNNVSLVGLAEYRGFLMLFTGDLDDPELIQDQDLTADLLKSPHHGSRRGNRQSLYDQVQPEYVVVMGRYPTPAGIEPRLAELGERYVNTRKDGAWELRFAGAAVRATPYPARRRLVRLD